MKRGGGSPPPSPKDGREFKAVQEKNPWKKHLFSLLVAGKLILQKMLGIGDFLFALSSVLPPIFP